MIKLIIAAASFAGFAYIGWEFYKGYMAAGGYQITVFHRLVLATEGSAVILWSRFGTAVSLLISALANVADYFNLPGVGSALTTYLTPTTVSLLTAGLLIVSEMARRRTLNKD